MKKILLGIFVAVVSLVVATAPVFAKQTCTLTSVLGNAKCDSEGNKDDKGTYNCSCDNGKGSEVKNTLSTVVDIMSVGIGILGVIGITIVGTQYLTAGGNEEKTRKAKRRMFEIIIGLVAYALIYAIIKWLMPSS